MCKYCEEGTTYQEIFQDGLTGDWYLLVETSEWDDYDDDYIKEKIYINYCPFCGRMLLNEGIEEN